MKITNKLNLPECFINVSNREFSDDRFSVTELLNSTREIILKRKYYNEIEKDVCDVIPALFGSAVHKILEENTTASDTLKPEFKIECKIDGVDLVGIIDLLDLASLTIKDYKTCSVSKISKGDFNDWKLQGLAYAYILFIKYGIIIKHLEFYALMKDWSKVKAGTSANYPSSPVYVWKYDLQDSDYDYIEKLLKDKIKDIKAHDIDNLPECTDTDRWYTGTTYAVFKNETDKRATILCDTEQEAHDYINNKLNGNGIINVRKGEYLKCKYYCDVCKFCPKLDF